ncbi:ATP synthase F1 subcomplex delta subunit [Aliiruegeria haliotis]|uniref:ATP synthase subunit delta n=1 Tax=Aliiruegeria haliotis TaxID=1280846 RepID=A0A2T0RRB7_9RHOB|nr:F0F1 ATP synthase subunit delta [Aliiruegeria haliotis]PRY23650.1 ATP synthase F1 subcomplex delta subunit [Aliiruegeria haliotis]
MSETASISSSIAGRYAQALFELAKDEGKLDALEADTDALSAALDASADLQNMINSPVYSRADQTSAIMALADKMNLGEVMKNGLGLMASNRRLFTLSYVLKALAEKIAEEKGEVTADVTSATALSDAQAGSIAEMLKSRFGKDIKLNTTVDESLIGGLIVKVGSKMVDTSVRAKLANLQNAMKEVG